MKILFWSEFFWPHIGGIEVRVGHLAAELCHQGHECAVITNRVPSELPAQESWRGMTIHRMNIRQTVESRDVRRLRRLCEEVRELRRTFRPDLEQVYVSGPSFPIQRVTNREPLLPTITSVQTALEEFPQRGEEIGRMLESSVAVLAVSEHIRRGLCHIAPRIAGRVQLLPNCLPMPTLSPAPLPMHPPVILCLGRLVLEKGFDVALRALAKVPDVRLIVAGDGSQRNALETLSCELGLARRVTFPGWVDPTEVPALINSASLVVMPSRWQEAFGLVSLQAAQMARPVVATRVGGIPEVVVDGETGLLVDNEDVDGMAMAITALLANPARMQSMGERARQRAMAQFGFAAYVARHLELFQRHAFSQ